MIVQPKVGSFVPVRNCKLPNGKSCKKDPCPYYPNCYNGNMCQLAHGQKELDYWEGTYVCMHLGLPFSLVVYLVVDCVVCHNLGDFLAIHTYTHETTCDVRK